MSPTEPREDFYTFYEAVTGGRTPKPFRLNEAQRELMAAMLSGRRYVILKIGKR